MRRAVVLACILTLTLLLVPLAAAAKEAAGDKRAERAERALEKDDRHDEKKAPAFLAAFRALRASWHENATAIREGCHAAEPDANATKEERAARAHCIRDGYKAWMTGYRAERREMRAHAAGAA